MSRLDAASSDVTSTPHSDDRLLVQQLLRGESSAWQTFVDTHGRLVRSRVADVAASFGRSADMGAIDDATAEVFAALLGNDAAALRAFSGRSSLGTYLAVIATRSATRGFARRHWTTSVSDSDITKTACDQAPDPVTTLIAEEQQEKLHQLLDRLSPKQRSVVTLFHLQGKSYVEISEQLEIPIGSVGPTLRRSEAKLREWMESG